MKKAYTISIIIFVCICLLAIGFVLNYTNNNKIPKVYFEGDISDMSKKSDERIILLKYESENLQFEKYAKIKVQGSSSLKYEKKNYTINLYNDEECKDKSKIAIKENWGEQSKYCLKANWIDKTHSRNIVSARIARKIQQKYGVLSETISNGLIDGFPVEIYANNEFLGLYTLNIPKDAWLWSMDKKNSNHLVIEGTSYKDETLFKKTIDDFDSSGWEIENGDETDEGKKIITEKMNRLIDFVQNSTDEEFVNNFEEYFDKDSALNYLIGLYVFDAKDNYGKNVLLVSYDGNKWYLNLYDLDSTFGTDVNGKKLDHYEWLPERRENQLLNRIIKCMSKELSDRWFELREDILTKDNILKEFNLFLNEIPEETFQKEQNRWKNIPGFDIEQVEEFLDFRLPYVDNVMSNR